MRKSRLFAALILGSAAVATATATANPAPPGPAAPRIDAFDLAAPKLALPQVPRPQAPRLGLRPVEGGNPRRLAGTVVSFDGTRLVVRTDGGRTHSALVTATTNVVCPLQEAIDAGRVFNPVVHVPRIGAGGPATPPEPQLHDRYACSIDELAADRRVAGAALGRDAAGQLRWIGVALSPR